MSKTVAILLGLALVWLSAWSIAACSSYRSGTAELAKAEELRATSTRLERGADVRVEGTLVSAPNVKALLSGRPCLAAQAKVWARSHYKDSQDNWVPDSALVKVLSVGPPNIEVAVRDERIQLPLDRWVALGIESENVSEIPSGLDVTKGEIDAAKKQLRGDFEGYAVGEATIEGGAHVFVVGRLEAGDGPLRLEADRVLGRVELYLGTQAEYVAAMVKKGNTLHTIAWVFGPIGLPPIVVLGVVMLVRWRRRRPAST